MWASIRTFLWRVTNIIHRGRSVGSIDRELEFHLEMEMEQNIRSGMSPEEARRSALLALGGVDQTRELYREAGAMRWLDASAGDVRYAIRMFRKNPVLFAAAIITLTLCIGANTAIFSMLYALIIRPLPFHESGRIVEITNSWPKDHLDRWPGSVQQYEDFRDHTDTFVQLGLWEILECTVGEPDGPVRSFGVRATADMFGVLDVKPIAGRFFTMENNRPANDKVLVLTQSFWESRFRKDPGILGRSMQIDGASHQIIGVAPRELEAFDARIRFIVPLSWSPNDFRASFRYNMIPRLYGQLKPGTTIEAAYSQIAGLERRFYESAPPNVREPLDRSGHRMSVDTVQDRRTEPVRSRIYLLEGGVLFVLLIGCSNIANLLLARSNAREPELAVRIALGAERGTIVRQLFIESFLLSCTGAVLGLAFAWGTLKAANRFKEQLLPNALPFAIDSRVLGFTVFLAVATALFIGLFPVLHVLGRNLVAAISSQRQILSAGHSTRSVSGTLIVVQMAVTLMLLAGAGLLLRSFVKVLEVDAGFNPRQLITARVALPLDYRRGERGRQFPQTLLNQLRQIPGLKSLGLATDTPYQERPYFPYAIEIRDYIAAANAPASSSYNLGASVSYMDTMQIPMIEGRWFRDADIADNRNRYVVDQDFAKRFFPGETAVGRYMNIGGVPANPEGWGEIIGVAANVHYLGVEEKTGLPFVYYPLKEVQMDGISIFLRGDRSASDLLTEVRKKVRSLDPSLAVFREGSMESFSSASFVERQAIMLLLCGFAGIALLLSAVGIYSVLACTVSQRMREISIRSALGATRRQVTKLILQQGLWRAGIGLVLGLAGSLLLSRFITSLLFDLRPTDPFSYGAVSILLLVVALLASYLPAQRAARIDPVIALRSE